MTNISFNKESSIRHRSIMKTKITKEYGKMYVASNQ